MAIQASVGHAIDLAILYLDQHGNPMLEQPKPATPPTWTQTTPATESLTVAADGLTAVALPVASGSDTLQLGLTVDGVDYSAILDVNVIAEFQTLTSVAIDAKVS